MSNGAIVLTPKRIIESSFSDMNVVFRQGIFSPEGTDSPFFKACLTLILINTNDILQQLSKLERRVTIADDVQLANGSGDVTDLISACRNAACHQISKSYNYKTSRLNYFRIIGFGSAVIDGDVFQCPYHDDQAIFFGGNRLLLSRNLGRSLIEAQNACNELGFTTWQ